MTIRNVVTFIGAIAIGIVLVVMVREVAAATDGCERVVNPNTGAIVQVCDDPVGYAQVRDNRPVGDGR